MKTKKIERVSLIYVISFLIIFASSLYLSSIFVESIVLIWAIALSVLILLIYGMYRHTKKLLFVEFEKYLQLKIQQKEWPDHLEFPMKEHIECWISGYSRSIKGFLSYNIIWLNITDGNSFYLWVGILKKLCVDVIGVNGGISLFDLYYLTSIYVNNADVNSTSSCYELEKTRAFLQYMPVKDLTVYVHPPIHLTVQSLYWFMIRDEKVGNFNEVCYFLMKSNCEIIAPMDVIEQLISEKKQQIRIVFPQRFLAYLVKMEVENRFRLKSDPEKRKKVFDWYMSQSLQEFDFYSYWPKFTPEELEYVLSIFESECVRDEIFVSQHNWEHVSTQRLQNERVTPDKRDEITEELLKRIPKEQ